jgi:hypothetical protein
LRSGTTASACDRKKKKTLQKTWWIDSSSCSCLSATLSFALTLSLLLRVACCVSLRRSLCVCVRLCRRYHSISLSLSLALCLFQACLRMAVKLSRASALSGAGLGTLSLLTSMVVCSKPLPSLLPNSESQHRTRNTWDAALSAQVLERMDGSAREWSRKKTQERSASRSP